MKTVAYIFKKILYPACALFTIIWFLMCIVIDAVSDVININLASTIMCFVIALAIASCNLILSNKKIPFVGRFFIHMALSVGAVSVIVALFSEAFSTAYPITTRSFYLVLILIFAYLVIATPALLFYHHLVLVPKEKQH